jgi:hypothetical protein
MKILRNLIVPLGVAIAMLGCTTSTGSSDSWSESYLAPIDRVFDAVVDVLEDEGYLVETKREVGKITAEPSRSSRGLSPSLAVKVVEKAGQVRVDVQTRAGVNQSVTQGRQIEASIVEFFHELELRMQGFKD